MGYYVFVDNSNVWIEGKYASAVKKGMVSDICTAHDRKISDNSWKIDFGKLLSCAVDGDIANVKEAIIVASKPTQKDSLWKAMASAGFKVETEQRNFANKEKKIDTGIVQKINRKLFREAEDGDVFVLVLGDSDYVPTVEDIEADGKTAKIVFWDNVAGELVASASEYKCLNECMEEIELKK